ncbi:hypothetical protein AB5J49_02110 [Streptomyces sp. R28]|uniref:Uncharacterized protein n=1 Tax=Streptomyces sp. R28 TaxID=3238628 RepID=A0AB39PPI7_9ACTN
MAGTCGLDVCSVGLGGIGIRPVAGLGGIGIWPVAGLLGTAVVEVGVLEAGGACGLDVGVVGLFGAGGARGLGGRARSLRIHGVYGLGPRGTCRLGPARRQPSDTNPVDWMRPIPGGRPRAIAVGRMNASLPTSTG